MVDIRQKLTLSFRESMEARFIQGNKPGSESQTSNSVELLAQQRISGASDSCPHPEELMAL